VCIGAGKAKAQDRGRGTRDFGRRQKPEFRNPSSKVKSQDVDMNINPRTTQITQMGQSRRRRPKPGVKKPVLYTSAVCRSGWEVV